MHHRSASISWLSFYSCSLRSPYILLFHCHFPSSLAIFPLQAYSYSPSSSICFESRVAFWSSTPSKHG